MLKIENLQVKVGDKQILKGLNLEVKAGEFVWRPPGSRHVAWSPNGGEMIGIFQVPNKFFDQPGRVTDSNGKDWSWDHALSK